MKRIKSCWINGRKWRIIWSDLSDAYSENGYPVDGYCDPLNHIIELDSNVEDNASIAEILIHEMLHGMWPDVSEEWIDMRASELFWALERAELIREEDD